LFGEERKRPHSIGVRHVLKEKRQPEKTRKEKTERRWLELLMPESVDFLGKNRAAEKGRDNIDRSRKVRLP